jgi:hypothetical protein
MFRRRIGGVFVVFVVEDGLGEHAKVVEDGLGEHAKKKLFSHKKKKFASR